MLDLNAEALVFLVTAVIAAHLMLGLMSARWGALYVLLAGFIIVSPLSAATELPFLEASKYARVYVTFLMIAFGLVTGCRKVGPAGRMLIVFLMLYTAAALWSDRALSGLAFKGLAAMAVTAGVFVGSAEMYSSKLLRGIQLPLYAGALFGLLIIAHLVVNPSAISHIGRLAAWGMNPNRIAQTAAPLALIALYFALFYPTRYNQVMGWSVLAVLLITILYTGSRASLGMFVVGGVVFAFNLSRQIGRVVIVGLVLITFIAIALEYMDTSAASRITDVSLDTRQDFWQAGWDKFLAHPWVGWGWSYTTDVRASGSTINHLSIYIQTLVEVGMLGITVLGLTMLYIVLSLIRAYRAIRDIPWLKNMWFLVAALIAGIFAHGIFESSVLMGSTINTVLLGFAVGLAGALPRLALTDRAALFAWYDAHQEAEIEASANAQAWGAGS